VVYHRPTGGAEIITAVPPLSTPLSCWAVVASFSEDAFPSAHLGQLYWATLVVRIAALAYLAMAVVTFSTLFSVRRGLRRFAERARRIRNLGPMQGRFQGGLVSPSWPMSAPSLIRMVDALHRSAAEIRSTAEENAHAFKTPIAVIRQLLEPLRRALSQLINRDYEVMNTAVLIGAFTAVLGPILVALDTDGLTTLLGLPQSLADFLRYRLAGH
jgi:two-component system sensor histidine kinase ChvG